MGVGGTLTSTTLRGTPSRTRVLDAPPPTANAWTDALLGLREEFLEEARQKLTAVAQLLGRLTIDPQDHDALRELHRRFHGFAGSGTSYGFPEVSRLGSRAEATCAKLLGKERIPGPVEISEWRTAEKAIRANLSLGSDAKAKAPVVEKAAPPALSALVVGDAETSGVATRILEGEGMTVRTAGSRAAALAVIAERVPDVLLADVTLPDGSGYDLVEELRRRPGETPAALVISVRNDFQGRVRGVTCGADGYFEKPVDWEALVRRMNHAIERTRTEPGRVLSVEDDPAEAAFLRSVLESGGYEFQVCTDPKRFEAALTSFKPDLVLMDVNLPGFSGYDLVRYVRQNERYPTLPILFLTTENAMGAHMEAARSGGDDHLVKPVAPGFLLSTVAARVERARFVKSLLERDGLTRLLTHTACHERAVGLMKNRTRHPERPAAWVMLDLDHFKSVNDKYGHPTGDKVLQSLAGMLRRRLRHSDAVARHGGEEFVILLEELNQAEAIGLVSRLLEEFAATPHTASDGTKFFATFSAGVAPLDAATASVEGWKQAADDALYRAKRAGRNRVVGLEAVRSAA